jgi:hypothetical protein
MLQTFTRLLASSHQHHATRLAIQTEGHVEFPGAKKLAGGPGKAGPGSVFGRMADYPGGLIEH